LYLSESLFRIVHEWLIDRTLTAPERLAGNYVDAIDDEK